MYTSGFQYKSTTERYIYCHQGRKKQNINKMSSLISGNSSSFSNLNPNFQLEKVLQPCEVADACEPYLKDDKNKERLMQTAQQYCERLGAFRMPLGWFAIDLNQILNRLHHPDKTEALTAAIASSVAGVIFLYYF